MSKFRVSEFSLQGSWDNRTTGGGSGTGGNIVGSKKDDFSLSSSGLNLPVVLDDLRGSSGGDWQNQVSVCSRGNLYIYFSSSCGSLCQLI